MEKHLSFTLLKYRWNIKRLTPFLADDSLGGGEGGERKDRKGNEREKDNEREREREED